MTNTALTRRGFLSSGVAFAALCERPSAVKGKPCEPPEFKSLEKVKYLDDGGKVWCFSNRGHSQMLSTVFVSPEGLVLVVDGGSYADADFLRRFLASIGGRVDYWLITHAHEDHFGALTKMHDGFAAPVLDIGEIIWNFPDRTWCEKHEPRCAKPICHWFDEFLPGAGSKVRRGDCTPGRIVKFGSWSFEILNDPILCHREAINNTSTCLTVTAGGKRWLVTGDLAVEGGKRLAGLRGDEIRHDVVFMAHHGQNGVNKDFYAAVKPEIAVWPTPDWLWDNRALKQTAGSGPWMTNYTKCWLQELGVKKNYVLTGDCVFTA